MSEPVLEALGAALIVASVAAAFVSAAWLRRAGVAPELTRKTAHFATSVAVLPLPYVVHSRWTLAALGAFFAALVGLLRRRGKLRFLDDVRRSHLSEYGYIAAIFALHVGCRGRPALFVVPMLVLGVSDAAAALVGRRFGRHRYGTPGGARSWEGSAVFAASAFVIVALAGALAHGGIDAGAARAALLVALVAAAVEAVSVGGTDNLWIPVTTFGLLAAARDGAGAEGIASAHWVVAWVAGVVLLRRRVPPAYCMLAGLLALDALAWSDRGAWPLAAALTGVAATSGLALVRRARAAAHPVANATR
jgi:phytol kinase